MPHAITFRRAVAPPLFLLVVAVALLEARSVVAQEVAGWPAEVRAIEYRSAADDTLQPALYFNPPGDQPRPLLVALHSWSGDYRQTNPAYGLWCIAKGWTLIHPNFRGVNQRPEACGSELAVADILSAVDYAKKNASIDPKRIYIMGASGGGYMSLVMAGRAPDVWAGVSAWCPIFDLRVWHADTQKRDLKYWKMLEQCCGGAPGASDEVKRQYRVRSASAWLSRAANVHVDISTGITDGHDGSVPISHTLSAFNALAEPALRVPEATIAAMVARPTMPDALRQSIDDPLFRRKPALFRQISKNCRTTIFQGGHDVIYEAGLAWLEQQRLGEPPVWNVRTAPDVDLTKLDEKSGK